MSRIAKADVNAALARAAQIIRSADLGKDGVISRADIKAKLATMETGTEKALVDIFYRFADHRDAKKYAKLTGKDLEKTLAYAAKELVADYDLNRNGLSKAEIARMSTTAKLAVELAKTMKAEPAPTTGAAPVETVQWN